MTEEKSKAPILSYFYKTNYCNYKTLLTKDLIDRGVLIRTFKSDYLKRVSDKFIPEISDEMLRLDTLVRKVLDEMHYLIPSSIRYEEVCPKRATGCKEIAPEGRKRCRNNSAYATDCVKSYLLIKF